MVRLNNTGLQAQTAGGKKEPEEGKRAQSNPDIVRLFSGEEQREPRARGAVT